MDSDRVLAVLGRGIVDPSAPLLRADDLGVLRGDGVFETVRVAAGRPVVLERHLERFAASATRLALALPAAGAWRDLVAVALAAWPYDDGVLRLVCTRGPDAAGAATGYALLTAIPAELVHQREHGIDVVTLTLGRPASAADEAPWLLRGVKSTSYAVNLAALRAGAALGADDVVFVSSDGEVLEAPTSTVGWVSGGTFVTPPDEVGILRGTTVEAVLRSCARLGVPAERRRGRADELATADEVLLMSSIRGVAPVLSVDGRPVGGGAVGPVTAALRAVVERVATGGE